MKLVILDRDGVINADSEHYIKSPDEFHILPGVFKAICLLNQASIKVAVATNQSGVARKYFDETVLAAIHQKLHDQLAKHGAHIDAIFYCPHGPDEGCDCRKPKPGLLQQALEHFSIPPEEACFIGDSIRDVQAALEANCLPLLVRTGNGKKTLHKNKELAQHIDVFNDLLDFTQQLLN